MHSASLPTQRPLRALLLRLDSGNGSGMRLTASALIYSIALLIHSFTEYEKQAERAVCHWYPIVWGGGVLCGRVGSGSCWTTKPFTRAANGHRYARATTCVYVWALCCPSYLLTRYLFARPRILSVMMEKVTIGDVLGVPAWNDFWGGGVTRRGRTEVGRLVNRTG